MKNMLAKYRVRHKIATMYHLQTNRHIEISNQEVKKIFQKRVNNQTKDWEMKPNDAL